MGRGNRAKIQLGSFYPLTGSSHAIDQALPYHPLVQALRLVLPLRDPGVEVGT
jgi:hypothetical protein